MRISSAKVVSVFFKVSQAKNKKKTIIVEHELKKPACFDYNNELSYSSGIVRLRPHRCKPFVVQFGLSGKLDVQTGNVKINETHDIKAPLQMKVELTGYQMVASGSDSN